MTIGSSALTSLVLIHLQATLLFQIAHFTSLIVLI